MNHDCLFCRIASGELPCEKVYEDELLLAFMDIGPIIKGHTLVIPKAHHDPLLDTPDQTLEQLILLVKRVARAQRDALGAEGCNVIQNNGTVAGQAVPHLHFHVIPRYTGDGHKWNWAARKYDDPDTMKQLAQQIKNALEK